MFKDFPGLCKEWRSQTETDKSFKIDFANKCTRQGLHPVVRTRDWLTQVRRLRMLAFSLRENTHTHKVIPNAWCRLDTMSLPVFCMGRRRRCCHLRLGSSISLCGKNPTPSISYALKNTMTKSCRASYTFLKKKKNLCNLYLSRLPFFPPQLGQVCQSLYVRSSRVHGFMWFQNSVEDAADTVCSSSSSSSNE